MFAPEFDPSDLQQMGWGLVMPFDLHHDIRDALEPQLKMREQQAGERFRLIEYRHGESASAFLSRHGLDLLVVDTALPR